MFGLFLVGIIIFSVWGVWRVHRRQGGGQIFYIAEPSPGQPAIRLHRRQGRYILIDTEADSRETNRGRSVYNPLRMDREKLLSHGDGGEHRNPWLAFQTLYLDYYSVYYCRRFDRCEIERYDPEVRIAYDYWKESHS